MYRGDAAWLDRVPRWRPADVSAEETQLLLENRAFELLLAWPGLAGPAPLPRLLARHAVLKCALDVVRVEALSRGEYPDGAAALVAWAAAGHRAGAGRWTRCSRRRWPGARGEIRALETDAARREWRAAVARLERPVARARRARAATTRCGTRAGRGCGAACAGPCPRRTRSGLGPSLAHRLRHALRGTPQHRVNAAAAILLLAADADPADRAEPALPAAAARALAALGVAAAAAPAGWPAAARATVEAWDRWVLDGQRTAEDA